MTYLNDETGRPPRLRCDLNMGTVWDLPEWSTGPRGDWSQLYGVIADAGYEGVQAGDVTAAADAGLGCTTMGTVHEPGQLGDQARQWMDAGFECATLHVGTGLERDREALGLLEEVVAVSEELGYPLFVETHRATVTQDIRRAVDFVERLPELRFNADLSHWYTGLEMTYGDFDAKLDVAEPVLERTGFVHGRIGDPGCIQVDVGNGDHPSVDHFREMWRRAMTGFRRDAGPGDVLVFAPELLPSAIHYARTVPDGEGGRREEGDRWEQARVLCHIAEECWADTA
jgi:sugar phosphate isomerase/epimerase